VETVGSVREEPEAEHHLRVEKARSSLQSYSTVVLGPRVDYPLHRVPTRISQNLCVVSDMSLKILASSTRV
jgi:hypothetical protein